MFDFPASPAENQIFNAPGGPSYIYNAPAWKQSTPGPVPATGTAQDYNRVVNGAMQHSQENGDTASVTAASGVFYAADQFTSSWSLSTGTIGTARSGLTPKGSKSVLMITGAAVTSLAAASYALIQYKIEGNRVADLQWGTASAQQIILRFSTAMAAGVYSFRIINPTANDRSYVAQWTQASTAWQVNTFVIPGDTTGTWLKDTGIGLMIEFCWAMGSSFLGVLGWQAGNKYTAAGQISSIGAGSGFYLGDVGLYADPNATGVAPPWQTPDYASELLTCMRYWQTNLMTLFNSNVTTSVIYRTGRPLVVPMRSTPTLTGVVASGILAFPNTVGTLSVVGDSLMEYRTANATGTGLYCSYLTANARM